MAKRFKDLNPVRKHRLIMKAGGGRGAGKKAAKAYNKNLPNKTQKIPQAGTVQKTQTPLSAKIGSGTVQKTQAPSVVKNQPKAIPQVGTVAKTQMPDSVAKEVLNQQKREFFRSQGMIPGTAKHAKRFGLNAAPAAQGGGAATTQPFNYDPGYQLSIDGGSFSDFKDMLASRYIIPGREGGDPRAMDSERRARLDARDPLSGLQKLQYAIGDFDPGQVSLAAQRAGITNVSSEKDFQELYNELTRPSTGMQTGDTGRRGRRDPAKVKYKKSVNQAIADGTLTVGELKRIAGKHDKSRAGVKTTAGRLFDKNFPGRELTIRTPGMGRKNIAAAEAAAQVAEGGGGPKVEGTDPESLIQMLLAGIAASNQAQALNQRLGYVAPQFGLNPFNMQGIGAFRSGGNQFGTPSPFMGLSQIAS